MITKLSAMVKAGIEKEKEIDIAHKLMLELFCHVRIDLLQADASVLYS